MFFRPHAATDTWSDFSSKMTSCGGAPGRENHGFAIVKLTFWGNLCFHSQTSSGNNFNWISTTFAFQKPSQNNENARTGIHSFSDSILTPFCFRFGAIWAPFGDTFRVKNWHFSFQGCLGSSVEHFGSILIQFLVGFGMIFVGFCCHSYLFGCLLGVLGRLELRFF